MKPKDRQRAIIQYLKQYGKVSVEKLAAEFDTTGTTIRKDLTQLEKDGEVLRTYGSVVLASNEEPDLPIDSKTNINLVAKQAIAKAAAELLKEGDSLILDAGSTVLQIVPFLTKFDNLTIMTNSLHIINSLASLNKNYNLLMCGGTYRAKSGSLHGSLAEATFDKFTFDKLFIGADGFDLNVGSTTFNEVHAVSQAMCRATKKVIVLVDSSKFGRFSPNVVCPLDKIHTIITDKGIDSQTYHRLLDKGIEVILV